MVNTPIYEIVVDIISEDATIDMFRSPKVGGFVLKHSNREYFRGTSVLNDMYDKVLERYFQVKSSRDCSYEVNRYLLPESYDTVTKTDEKYYNEWCKYLQEYNDFFSSRRSDDDPNLFRKIDILVHKFRMLFREHAKEMTTIIEKSLIDSGLTFNKDDTYRYTLFISL